MMDITAPYCVNPQQTIAVARRDGLRDDDLTLSGAAVLTFSKVIMDKLEESCQLRDVQWVSARHHPYCAARVVKRGHYQGLEISALVPPMGASPLACVVEDLIACGVQAVMLVCSAWSLGPPVAFGDLIVPQFSVGLDGTSIHYGNDKKYIAAQPPVVESISAACRALGVKGHVGGNATCEALYRITPQFVAESRDRGCLCMDNGEVNTLFAMAKAVSFYGGVLFQPYIDLSEGWDPNRMDEVYQATCVLQAEIVLDAIVRLKEQGLL